MQADKDFVRARGLLAESLVSRADYDAMCAHAEADHAGFWAKLARDQLARSGSVAVAAELAREYGFTDVDGRVPEPLTIDSVLIPVANPGVWM